MMLTRTDNELRTAVFSIPLSVLLMLDLISSPLFKSILIRVLVLVGLY